MSPPAMLNMPVELYIGDTLNIFTLPPTVNMDGEKKSTAALIFAEGEQRMPPRIQHGSEG
jgi:hypothetical protein